MILFFHPEARDEFTEAAFYYESKQPGLGYRFQEEVRLAASAIAHNVQLFREKGSPIRSIGNKKIELD